MQNLVRIICATLMGLTFSCGFAQEHDNHEATGSDLMTHLDADLEAIRQTEDPAKRKEMLIHHLQMMGEHMKTMSVMDHGGMMGGEGMKGMDHSAMMGGEGMKGMDHGTMKDGEGMKGMDHSAMMGGEGMKGMDHSAMMAGEGMDMMQHHQHMVKMMEHMLATQELMLGLIGNK